MTIPSAVRTVIMRHHRAQTQGYAPDEICFIKITCVNDTLMYC